MEVIDDIGWIEEIMGNLWEMLQVECLKGFLNCEISFKIENLNENLGFKI